MKKCILALLVLGTMLAAPGLGSAERNKAYWRMELNGRPDMTQGGLYIYIDSPEITLCARNLDTRTIRAFIDGKNLRFTRSWLEEEDTVMMKNGTIQSVFDIKNDNDQDCLLYKVDGASSIGLTGLYENEIFIGPKKKNPKTPFINIMER